MQQEFIVMNNFRRNAYLQQHHLHPNALLPNSLLSVTAASPYEHPGPAVYPIPESVRSAQPLIYGPTAYVTEFQRPIYQKYNDGKPLNAPAVVQSSAKEIHPPAMKAQPIYFNEMNANYIQDLRHLQDLRYAQHLVQQPQFEPVQTIYENREPIYLKEMPRNDHPKIERSEYFANSSKIISPNSEIRYERPGFGNYYTYISPNENANAKQPPQQPTADEVSIKMASDRQSQYHRNLPFITRNHALQENQYHFNHPANFKAENTSSVKPDLNSPSKDDRLLHFTSSYKPNVEKQSTETTNFNANIKDNSPRVASILNEPMNEVYKYATNIEPQKEKIRSDSLSSEFEREIFFPSVESVDKKDPMPSNTQQMKEFSLEKNNQKDDSLATRMANQSNTMDYPKQDDFQQNRYYRNDLNNITKTPESKPTDTSNDQSDYLVRSSDKRRSSIDSIPMENKSEHEDELHKMSAMAHRRYSAAVNSLNLQRNARSQEPAHILSSFASHNVGNVRENTASNRYDNQKSIDESLNKDACDSKESAMKSFQSNAVEEIRPNPQITDDIHYDNTKHISTNSASLPPFPVDAMNENYHENIKPIDVEQNSNANVNVDAVYAENIDASYANYGMNDQIVLENAMENLHLKNAPEQDAADETQLQKVDSESYKNRAMHG